MYLYVGLQSADDGIIFYTIHLVGVPILDKDMYVCVCVLLLISSFFFMYSLKNCFKYIFTKWFVIRYHNKNAIKPKP